MRIINLVENELGETGCEAAHGLSVFNQMKEIMGDQLTYVRSGDEVRTLILTEKLVGAKDIVTL